MPNKKLIPAVVFCAFVLSACGGGGGGSSAATPPTTPASAPPAASSPGASSGSSAPLATSATNPFASNSAQATIFAAVNSYRSQVGAGVLADDPILDTAAATLAGRCRTMKFRRLQISMQTRRWIEPRKPVRRQRNLSVKTSPRPHRTPL
jgi:hypothetical protein